ncbi:hypothetical protein [Sphingomonas oligophenolica]|uniref:hypothetical protein n=1 Tax=Sphingomonas oligophenolica TaxID=301154 RepID=UPI00112B80FE|nr:hypothetical protein [Sphingomonas oligophenolica]
MQRPSDTEIKQFSFTDTVSGVEISSSDFPNEARQLYCLWHGMHYLYKQIQFAEKAAKGEGLGGMYADLEGSLGLPDGANSLLPVFHHWFGVTAINFSRLFAWCLGVKNGEFSKPSYQTNRQRRNVSRYCRTYVLSLQELSAVLGWRNKVFAHFALTDPYSDDTLSTLMRWSVYPLRFISGRLWMSPPDIDIDENALRSISFGLSPSAIDWSLTETFNALNRRFHLDVPIIKTKNGDRFGKMTFPMSFEIPQGQDAGPVSDL